MCSNEIISEDTFNDITINESGKCLRRSTRNNRSKSKLISNRSKRSSRSQKLPILKEHNKENELNNSGYSISDISTDKEQTKNILYEIKDIVEVPIDIKTGNSNEIMKDKINSHYNELDYKCETKLSDETDKSDSKKVIVKCVNNVYGIEGTLRSNEISNVSKYFNDTSLNFESPSKLLSIVDEKDSKKELFSDNSNIFEDSFSVLEKYNTFNENLTENLIVRKLNTVNKTAKEDLIKFDFKSVSSEVKTNENHSKNCECYKTCENNLKNHILCKSDNCAAKKNIQNKTESLELKNETQKHNLLDFESESTALNVYANRLKCDKTDCSSSENTHKKSVSVGPNVEDSTKKLLDDKKNQSESLNTQECCKLAAWGLPVGILQKYKERGIEMMFPWQVECLRNTEVLQKDINLIYSAPTSAGKTLVAEILTIKTVIERRKKVLFILPFVSVVREKMFYFRDVFSSTGIRVEGFMGSYNPPGGFSSVHVAICTIEKANTLVNRMLEDSTVDDLGAIIVDELHLLGDPNRGYLLELLLTKVLYISLKNQMATVRIIGMSATLPNLALLATWLNAALYKTDFRPIPLFEKCYIEGRIYNSDLKLERVINPLSDIPEDNDNIIQLCLEVIAKSCSVLIFCTTKNWCENLAQQISSTFRRLGCGNSTFGLCLKSEIKTDMVTEVLEQLKRCPIGLDRTLRNTVSFGVAYHHAGLTMDERDIIESAFRNGALKVLVATSTLSSGVNLPARRVIIRSAMFAGRPIDTLTYKQMVGRAGRTGRDVAGESILICKKVDSTVAKKLMSASLKPISSCLEGSGKLKRAILEVIASGVVSTPTDVMLFTKCTLLAVEDDFELENPIETAINFLQRNEFIRLQNTENGDTYYVPTPLAKACLSSSIPPEEGLTLFAELEKARQCFVLESELHIIYLVTPYSVCSSWGNLDWMSYLNFYENLPVCDQRVANLVGVSEAFIVAAVNGKTFSSKFHQKLQVHKRFYTALALLELVNEIPLNVVAEKYHCSRGLLQSLQQSASTFAGMVTSFCRQLGWSSVEILVNQFQDRLQFGINRELLDLMRLPSLNGLRARALYNVGIESVVCLANSNACIVENALHASVPFQSEKEREGESSHEAEERNRLKTVWITGKKGLTERDAAEMLIDEARRYLQLELGLAVAKWETNSLHQKADPTDRSLGEEKASLFSSHSTEYNTSSLNESKTLISLNKSIGAGVESCKREDMSKKNYFEHNQKDDFKEQENKQNDHMSTFDFLNSEREQNLPKCKILNINDKKIKTEHNISSENLNEVLEDMKKKNVSNIELCSEKDNKKDLVLSKGCSSSENLQNKSISNSIKENKTIKNNIDYQNNTYLTLKEVKSNISATQLCTVKTTQENILKRKKSRKVNRKKMRKKVNKLYKDFVPVSEIVFNESYFNTSNEKNVKAKPSQTNSVILNNEDNFLNADESPQYISSRIKEKEKNQETIKNYDINTSTERYNLRPRYSKVSNKSGTETSDKNIFRDSFLLESNISALFNTSFSKVTLNLSFHKTEGLNNTNNKCVSNNDRKRKSSLSDSGLEFGETSLFEQAFITSFNVNDNGFDNNMIFSTPNSNNSTSVDSTKKILNLSINNVGTVDQSSEHNAYLRTTLISDVLDKNNEINESSSRKKVKNVKEETDKYNKEICLQNDSNKCSFESKPAVPAIQIENCTKIENSPDISVEVDLRSNVGCLNSKLIPSIHNIIFENAQSSSKYLNNNKKSLVSTKKKAATTKQNKYVDQISLNGMKMVNVCEDYRYFKFCNLQLMKQPTVSLCVGCENYTKAKKTIGMRIAKNRNTVKRYSDVNKFVYDQYQIKSIAMYWGGKSVYYFQLCDDKKILNVSSDDVMELLNRFFARKDLTVKQFDSKEQLKLLFHCCQINPDCCFEDPKIADWMIQPEDEEKSLNNMAIKYCPKFVSSIKLDENNKDVGSIGLSLDSSIVSHIRASAEALLTWKILEKQKDILINQNPSLIQALDIEMRSVTCLARLELSGFCINLDVLQHLVTNIRELMFEIENNAFSLAGRCFSFSSSTDVAKVVGLYKGRKVSTCKQVLEQVDNPLSDLVITWRKLSSALNKIILPITRAANGKSRIHCHSIFHNATGRISMQEPSLQMVPRDFDVDLNGNLKRISIRQAFMPSEHCVLISADYCQLELRLLAHFSQDDILCDVMRSGVDIFRSIAANWNNIPEFKVTDTQRQHVKQLCYAIIYGMGSKTLSDFLQIDELQATEFRESFKNFYPGVKVYLSQIVAKCEKNGFVETLHGRRRYLPHINDKSLAVRSQAERQAINTTIQGSAADIVKAAMVNVESKLRERYPWRIPPEKEDTQDNSTPRVNFVLHLHDELIFEVSSSVLYDVAHVIKRTLEESVCLSIPFPVKIRAGVSWGDLEELKFD